MIESAVLTWRFSLSKYETTSSAKQVLTSGTSLTTVTCLQLPVEYRRNILTRMPNCAKSNGDAMDFSIIEPATLSVAHTCNLAHLMQKENTRLVQTRYGKLLD